MTNTLNPNAKAALDIARSITHDQGINPTWTPTPDQIEFRVRDYLRDDRSDRFDRDRIIRILTFIFIDN